MGCFERVDGNIAIKSVSSGKYLDGRNDAHDNPLLTKRNPAGDRFLQWKIVECDQGIALESVSSGKYLDGRNKQHANPLLTKRNPSGDKFLQWIVVPLSN